MKSILFNADMVRAVLDGRKTQTRRIVPERIIGEYSDYDDYCNAVMPIDIPCTRTYEKEFYEKRTPYQPGDILWVRETWMPETEQGVPTGGYIYKASDNRPVPDGNHHLRWRPSIHMPREAARLFLRVTDIRAERLWDITEEDARAEGFKPGDRPTDTSSFAGTAKQSFMWTWQRLYDKSKHPWVSNPWVWVISFERTGEVEK